MAHFDVNLLYILSYGGTLKRRGARRNLSPIPPPLDEPD